MPEYCQKISTKATKENLNNIGVSKHNTQGIQISFFKNHPYQEPGIVR